MRKKIERNPGKNYYLNDFVRGQFLDSKAKTRGTALRFFENFCVIDTHISKLEKNY